MLQGSRWVYILWIIMKTTRVEPVPPDATKHVFVESCWFMSPLPVASCVALSCTVKGLAEPRSKSHKKSNCDWCGPKRRKPKLKDGVSVHTTTCSELGSKVRNKLPSQTITQSPPQIFLAKVSFCLSLMQLCQMQHQTSGLHFSWKALGPLPIPVRLGQSAEEISRVLDTFGRPFWPQKHQSFCSSLTRSKAKTKLWATFIMFGLGPRQILCFWWFFEVDTPENIKQQLDLGWFGPHKSWTAISTLELLCISEVHCSQEPWLRWPQAVSWILDFQALSWEVFFVCGPMFHASCPARIWWSACNECPSGNRIWTLSIRAIPRLITHLYSLALRKDLCSCAPLLLRKIFFKRLMSFDLVFGPWEVSLYLHCQAPGTHVDLPSLRIPGVFAQIFGTQDLILFAETPASPAAFLNRKRNLGRQKPCAAPRMQIKEMDEWMIPKPVQC